MQEGHAHHKEDANMYSRYIVDMHMEFHRHSNHTAGPLHPLSTHPTDFTTLTFDPPKTIHRTQLVASGCYKACRILTPLCTPFELESWSTKKKALSDGQRFPFFAASCAWNIRVQ